MAYHALLVDRRQRAGVPVDRTCFTVTCSFAVAILLGGCAPDAQRGPPEIPVALFDDAASSAAADTLTAELIRGPIAEIAADRYRGRLPGSPEDARTQAYLGALLADAGFTPAAPGGQWVQPFELIGIHTLQPPTWTSPPAQRRSICCRARSSS